MDSGADGHCRPYNILGDGHADEAAVWGEHWVQCQGPDIHRHPVLVLDQHDPGSLLLQRDGEKNRQRLGSYGFRGESAGHWCFFLAANSGIVRTSRPSFRPTIHSRHPPHHNLSFDVETNAGTTANDWVRHRSCRSASARIHCEKMRLKY